MQQLDNEKEHSPFWVQVLVIIFGICWVMGNLLLCPQLSLKPRDHPDQVQQIFSYNWFQLNNIRKQVSLDTTLKTLPHQTVRIIRQLKLFKRRKRGTRSNANRPHHHSLENNFELNNHYTESNLINIKLLTPRENEILLGKSFKFGLCNTQSIKNKEDHLYATMSQEKLDVCVLTETWLKNNDIDNCWTKANLFNTREYKFDTVNRKTKQGGGLGIIHHRAIKCKLLEKGVKLTFEYAIWKLDFTNKSLHIVAIYHPPNNSKGKSNTVFCDQFCDLISDISMKYENILYSGDFNIHVNDKDNSDGIQFLDLMEALGLEQKVHTPTHKHNNTLDLILTECSSNVKVSNINTGTYISDHKLVTCDINFNLDRKQNSSRTCRNYKKMDLNEFLRDLNFDHIAKSETEELDHILENVEQVITTALDKHAPLTEIKCGTKQPKLWYNKNLREQRKVLKKREHIYRKYDKQDHHWIAYKVERNKYTKMLRQAKQLHISKQVKSMKRDTKSLYSYVNTLTGCTQENPLPPSKSDSELANVFADFFLTKIEKIRDSLSQHPLFKPPSNHPPSFTSFRQMEKEEVVAIIYQMKSKSCETDWLPTYLIKENISYFARIITHIVNWSLCDGTFSENWKLAILRPLLKKTGLDLIANNYRPVSNLTFISKLVERCMMFQLNQHIDLHDLSIKFQSAYRKKYSCETAILKLVNDLLWSMERQELNAVVAIDLSAAFDTVDHEVLKLVLENTYGIQDKALQWFDSFLRDRRFKVSVGKDYSEEKIINYSVPQGSCSGPVLFCLYAGSIQSVIPDQVSLNAFADDHTMNKSCKVTVQGQTDTKQLLETTLCNIDNWMKENRLKMNTSKTEFMVFGSRPQLKKCILNSIEVVQDTIVRSNSIRLLGAWLDQLLTFNIHANKKCAAAMGNLQKLKQIRPYLDTDTCRLLVDSLVTSHLDYCNGILFGASSYVIKKLQRVQNQAAKLILQVANKCNSQDCLRKLHWLPVRSRIEFKLLLLLHKIVHGNGPSYLFDIIAFTRSREGLRSYNHNFKLIVPYVSKQTFAIRSFSVAGPRLWNTLPDSLRTEKDTETFKKDLKTCLFNKYFNSDSEWYYY